MRAEEIREMSDADIRTRVAEMEEERFRLKFRSATETLEDPLRLRFIRRDIARLKTIAHERGLGIERGGAQQQQQQDEEEATAAPAARKSAGRKTSAGRKAATR